MTHPYTEFYPETHGHFAPTRFVQPAYSAACVPFRWVLREKVEGSAKDGEIGIAERLKIGWAPDREPDIRNHQDKQVETAWVQERGTSSRSWTPSSARSGRKSRSAFSMPSAPRSRSSPGA